MWHGYILVEKLPDLGSGNWSALLSVFAEMGTHNSSFPAQNTHDRARLDGNAVIFESLFDPGEVEVSTFKQFLAEEFDVPVENITHSTDYKDYAGYGTTVWTFSYNDIGRFTVSRFGRGGSWEMSLEECTAYMELHVEDWEGQ